MSHGITEIDKGYVWGDTWHRLSQYIRIDVPVTPNQAIEVLDYPLEKKVLFRKDSNGNLVETNAWEIVRTDHDISVVSAVGKSFTVMNNRKLFEYINGSILSEFPDIKIESVGTLFKGQIAFVNLKMDEFEVKGDKSTTVSRLMYYNPLGLGKYKVCAHNIRVVCNNTLRMATNESINSGLISMISHTKNAEVGIKNGMASILALKQKFTEEKELLNILATKQMDTSKVEMFFDDFLPIKDESTKKQKTNITNFRNEIEDRFNICQDLDVSVARTGYGMLNAVTYVVDHEEPKRGNDVARVMWDGIIGNRSDLKVEALDSLKTVLV